MSKTSLSIAIIAVLLLGGAIYFAGNSEPAAETASNVVSTVKETVGKETASSTPTAATSTPTGTSASTTINVSVGVGKVKEFTVNGKSFSFSPSTITVKKGDSVKITFKNNEGYHDLVIDGYDISTKLINSGETGIVEFVADKAGEFKYYCSIGTHEEKGMVGKFIVQ